RATDRVGPWARAGIPRAGIPGSEMPSGSVPGSFWRAMSDLTAASVGEWARRRGQPRTALEQHNDTKELSRAQCPLGDGGKVVDNPVAGPDMAARDVPGWWPAALGAVDGARAARRRSTGYRPVFPRRLSTDRRSGRSDRAGR